jgi:hypothetical protein
MTGMAFAGIYGGCLLCDPHHIFSRKITLRSNDNQYPFTLDNALLKSTYLPRNARFVWPDGN